MLSKVLLIGGRGLEEGADSSSIFRAHTQNNIDLATPGHLPQGKVGNLTLRTQNYSASDVQLAVRTL